MDYTNLDWDSIIKSPFTYSPFTYDPFDAVQALLNAARVANNINGSVCKWADVYPMESFDYIVKCDSLLEFAGDIINSFVTFSPQDRYFRIEDDGRYRSYGWLEMSGLVDAHCNEIIQAAKTMPEVADSLAYSGVFFPEPEG